MNAIWRLTCRSGMVLAGLILLSLTSSARAQSVSDLIGMFQNLPSGTQQQLISQLTGTDTTTDTTGTTTEGESLPLGTDAITYARQGSPGTQVRAATQGEPIPPITIYPPPTPVDDPDLWDRVKEVVFDSLVQAFTDVWGLPINIPTAKTVDENY